MPTPTWDRLRPERRERIIAAGRAEFGERGFSRASLNTIATAAANAAGRDIWGLPKFVTPIKVDHHGRMIDVSVDDPDGGEPIMSLFGRAGLRVPSPQIPVMLYSPHEGQMLRVTVNGRGPSTTYAGGKVRLKVGSGTHPMAESLRSLGMDGLTPFAIQTTHASQSRLNKGVPIGR